MTTPSDIRKIMIDAIYPVGSVFTSTNDQNPGNTLKGDGWTTTWEAFSRGRTLVGAGNLTNDAGAVIQEFPANQKGGSTKVTLTKEQIAAHDHNMRVFPGWSEGPGGWSSFSAFMDKYNPPGNNFANLPYARGGKLSGDADKNYYKATGKGGGQADGTTAPHDNMPPYTTVYIWKRVA
jgi:microcystin-dependent protein